MNFKYMLVCAARKPIPERYFFTHLRLCGGANAAENTPDQRFRDWNLRLQEVHLTLTDKVILEVGSGRTARLALRMLAHGARRVILVDPYATLLDEPRHRSRLVQDCEQLGLSQDVLDQIDVLRCNLGDIPRPSPRDRVDVVVSSSVLEHVRDPQALFSRCWEWLKPGGKTHHMVDLRDHNLAFQYPLEMLTYSHAMWKNWIDLPGGFHLNRWRAGEYRAAMERAGFTNIRIIPTQCDRKELERVWPRVQPEFRVHGKEELAILGVDLFGEKD